MGRLIIVAMFSVTMAMTFPAAAKEHQTNVDACDDRSFVDQHAAKFLGGVLAVVVGILFPPAAPITVPTIIAMTIPADIVRQPDCPE